jgi:catechol 2,3-dioxygenase-like lactoylglutathione lyase family enzyme
MVFHSTVLFVKDIKVATSFYLRFLNFSIEHDFGKNVILSHGLSLWEISPEHIINRHPETGKSSNRIELYFEEEDLEELFRTLSQAGIKFMHPIQEEPWGQHTMRFFDPDNHLIEIGEPLSIFVNTMSKKGMSPAQISEKSGIPLGQVIGLIWK